LFIGVRGSGDHPQGNPANYNEQAEPYNMGSTVEPVEEEFQNTITKYSSEHTLTAPSVEPYGLHYPADPTNLITNFETLSYWDNVNAYMSSIWEGVYSLGDTLAEAEGNCPSQKIVLAGYSQGALVIHLALAELESTGLVSPNVIDAIVLVADPGKLSNGNEIKQGTAAFNTKGIYTLIFGGPLIDKVYGPPPPIPADLTGRTETLCDSNDPVCGQGPAWDFSVHTGYKTRDISELQSLARGAAFNVLLGPP
jgi:hypothetical protein